VARAGDTGDALLADHGLFSPFQWSAADQRVRYTTAFPFFDLSQLDDADPATRRVLGGAPSASRVVVTGPSWCTPPRCPPSVTATAGDRYSAAAANWASYSA
jgi:hypothetical protein